MVSANALAGLRKWVARDQWRDDFTETLDRHLARACEKAGTTVDQLPDLIGDHHSTIAWACAFEDFLTRDLDDGRNVADDYLKRRGWNESVANKTYISALRSSAMSLYEISDIVLDQSFLARDLVRGGEPVRVSEKSGTRYLKPWDRIAARIVQVGPRLEMAGGALPFPCEASEAVLKLLRRGGEGAREEIGRILRELERDAPAGETLTDTEMLRGSAFVFTHFWLDDLLQRTLTPVVPKMCNTDGDHIAFTTVSFPLAPRASAGAVRRAVESLPSLRQADRSFWNWIGSSEAAGRRPRPDRQTLVTTLDDGSLVLGTIELKGKTLILEANSPQRAERGRALIAEALGGMVGEPLVESRTVEEMMAAAPAERAEPLSTVPLDEARDIIHATLHEHYTKLLDQRVPVLDNMTPRRAAKSVEGREKVVAWLKLLENGMAGHDSNSLMAGYDVSWMWHELGVADLRR